MDRKIAASAKFIFAFCLLGTAASLEASPTPIFLIFSEGVDLNQVVVQLEKTGDRVRHVVPPNILIADLSNPLTSGTMPGIKNSYTGVVPMAQLEAMGPLAVAAGVQWNKSLVSNKKAFSSRSAFSSMSAAVSKETLSAPEILHTNITPGELSCTWREVQGATDYEIQVGADAQFSRLLVDSHSDRTSLILPLADGSVTPVFIRIRSLDRPQAEDPKADIIGEWSLIKELTSQNLALPESTALLTPTSPVDGIETVGFSVIVEWTGVLSGKTRVQISLSPAFDSTLIDAVVSEREYSLPSSSLHVGDTLYWRVKQWGPSSGPWSAKRTIKIGAPRSSLTDTFINPEAPK